MIIDLNESERSEMQRRSSDVSELVRILKDGGHENVSRESAFKAWSKHSESMAAGWLIIAKDPEGFREVGRAHESLVDDWKKAMHDYVVGGPRRADADVDRPLEPVRPRATPEDARNVAATSKLRSIGFEPDATIARSDERINRMEHIAGRLSNVAYMAHAIDAADGIAPVDRAPSVAGGQRQFDHMMDGGQKGIVESGRCYVALRRAQREGDHDRVRTGLVLMVAADNGEIGYKDVLKAIGDDGMPRQLKIEQERPVPRLTGAKGPAQSTEPATASATRNVASR
jgi:hypothetical protein